MIAIIDYDAGNLKSVEKALVHLGEEVVVSREAPVILGADKIILPGVGSFGEAMKKLAEYDLIPVIHQAVAARIPFLGICLGLQLLFQGSAESPDVKGLGLLKGEILRIPEQEGQKVPHMGWNSLTCSEPNRLFGGLGAEPYVYFVHSYYLKAADPAIVKARTWYNTEIHAAVEQDYIFGCQFHPEKSGDVGLKILKNFASLEREGC